MQRISVLLLNSNFSIIIITIMILIIVIKLVIIFSGLYQVYQLVSEMERDEFIIFMSSFLHRSRKGVTTKHASRLALEPSFQLAIAHIWD